VLVTESRDMLREWSPLDGKSQFETREKDFFFRRGGWGDVRTRGRGGGGGREWVSDSEGLEDACDDGAIDEEGDGVVNAADACVKDVRRAGMWTVFEGAV